MSKLSGLDYHRERAAVELERSRLAADPASAEAHRRLGELHLERLAQLEVDEAAKLSLVSN